MTGKWYWTHVGNRVHTYRYIWRISAKFVCIDSCSKFLYKGLGGCVGTICWITTRSRSKMRIVYLWMHTHNFVANGSCSLLILFISNVHICRPSVNMITIMDIGSIHSGTKFRLNTGHTKQYSGFSYEQYHGRSYYPFT